MMDRSIINSKMSTWILLLFSLASSIDARETDYCFAEESEPYLYMGTKTAYHFVHGGKTRFQVIPHCQPMQIWTLAVHGTRYPNTSEIDRMLSLVEDQHHIIRNHETRNNGHLCNRDLDNLRKWNPRASHLAMEMAEVLTPQGVEDMKLLARRLQSNFPELLQPNGADITSANYKFKSTRAPHSRDSMNAFMEGLFGSRTAVLPDESSGNDSLLATYKSCGIWDDKVSDGATVDEELKQFDTDERFQNLVYNVSRRLGYLYNISADKVLTMYDMCRYEKAWSVTQLSPWCAVFSKEELRILEYREDLHYYYYSGYGRDINARLGCPLLQDMMHRFWEVAHAEHSDGPRGIFYFTNVVSLQNLLTVMDIAKDQMQLTPFNYRDVAARQWRTSFISSFAANFVAVFYKCENSRAPYKVMFYLAEKPVLLEGCKVGLCDWDFFENKFGSAASNCKLDICSEKNEATSQLPSLWLAFLLASVSLVSLRYSSK